MAHKPSDYSGKNRKAARATERAQAAAETRERLAEAIADRETLERIAYTHLGLHTLETRNGDSLDFSDQAVWSLKAALEAAFKAGRESAEKS